MTNFKKPQFVILCVLDGWGIAPPGPGNAITLATTPNMNKFMASYPHTKLRASGTEVGLPKGEAGNTETGHLNLGAGRIVYQDLERINMSIADGTFFENKVLIAAFDHAKKEKSSVHLMGLIGGGGVHSSIEHLMALIKMAKNQNIQNLYLHLFTDGRDSPPTSSLTYIKIVEEQIKKVGIGKIASIMGRYYAMDRDLRWERTSRAYFALTKGDGLKAATPEIAVSEAYKKGLTDEFIEPTLISSPTSEKLNLIKDSDSVIFYNFRVDRPRQLTKAFVLNDFSRKANLNVDYELHTDIDKTNSEKSSLKNDSFNRGDMLKNLFFVTMTQYSKIFSTNEAHPAFPPDIVEMPIARVLSMNGINQLHMAESEKERFVTYYFNGQREQPFPLEDRLIIPSPKVATYDLMPEMSANELTKSLVSRILSFQYKFILINFANADMVGHTGNINQTVKAIETLDKCIGEISEIVNSYEGLMLITADHGNAEEMINLQTQDMDTEHSSNMVPLIIISSWLLGKSYGLPIGVLADVAPTILYLMGIPIPYNMSGQNLLKGNFQF